MYKAGRKWLVAGISALGGLLGLGTISGTSAKADTTAGAAKTVGAEDVAATQTSGTIPATSQTDETKQAAATPSTSTSTSTAKESVDTSKAGVSETTTDDTATKTTTPAATTTDATDGTATGTDATNTATQATGSTAASSSTTKETDDTAAANDVTANSTTTSESTAQDSETGSTDPSLSDAGEEVLDADTISFDPAELRGMLRMAVEDYGLTAAEAAQLTADVTSTAYKNGISAAQSDINYYINEIKINSLTNVTANVILTNNVKDGVAALSNLVSAYDANNTLQANDSEGTAQWKGKNYNGTGLDYNSGYAAYSAAFVTGLNQWLAGVKSASSDSDNTNANELLNATPYDPDQLNGDGSAGAVGSATAQVIINYLGNSSSFATNTLAYKSDSSNIADSSINSAVSTLKDYIKIIAPVLVNGIAKQALSDVRSIGGTIDDGDYAPAKLSQAIALNQGMKNLIAQFGFGDILDEPFLSSIYDSIRGNVQTAIESNWAKGQAQALNDFLGDGGNVYGGGTQSPYVSQLTNYSESDPAVIMNGNKGATLDLLSQATGYAWTQKVIGSIMTISSSDALGGTKKTSVNEVVDQLQSQGRITSAEADQIKNDDVTHSFGSSALDYSRKSTGVRQVIMSLYTAEYNAISGAVTDYQHNPKITDTEIAENQKQFSYESPSDSGLAAAHYNVPTMAYTQIIKVLRDLNAPFSGMSLADKLVYEVAKQIDAGADAADINWNPVFDTTVGGKTMPPAEEAGNLTSADWPLSERFQRIGIGGTTARRLPQFIGSDPATVTDFTIAPVNLPDATTRQSNLTFLENVVNAVVADNYDKELVIATRAFRDGQAAAEQQYKNSATGLIPDAAGSGVYTDGPYTVSASDDGTGVLAAKITTGNVLITSVPSKPLSQSGDIFTAGYELNLAKISLSTNAASSSMTTAFNNTSMKAANGTTLYTLVGGTVNIPAPTADSGWSVTSTDPYTLSNVTKTGGTATFTYTNKVAGFNYNQLTDKTGSYNGQNASSLLNDITYDLGWNDGTSLGTVDLDPSWLTVISDGAKVATYTYHLNDAGVAGVLALLNGKNSSTEALPTAARLALLAGTIKITQATDAKYLPTLNAHDATVVVNETVPTSWFVTDATSASGNPLPVTDVTSDGAPYQWGTPGTHQIELKLYDPTSNQTVVQTVTATVYSVEASGSASESMIVTSMTSQLDSISGNYSASKSANIVDSQEASKSEFIQNSQSTSREDSQNASISTAEESIASAEASLSADASNASASVKDQSENDTSTYSAVSESEASLSIRISTDLSQLSAQSEAQSSTSAASLSDFNSAQARVRLKTT